MKKPKFKTLVWITVIYLPIILITGFVSSLFSDSSFWSGVLIATIVGVIGPIFGFTANLFYKPKITPENVLGSLYDPEEILEQTDKSDIKQWIKIFRSLGYSNIANQYKLYIEGKKFNFRNLPDPDEIRNEFMKRYKNFKK